MISRRFLSFVLSFSLVFLSLGFSNISYASAPGYLCQEHEVFDIPGRDDDFCWECFVLQRGSADLLAEDTGTNPIILDSYFMRLMSYRASTSSETMTAINTGWTSVSAPYLMDNSYYFEPYLDVIFWVGSSGLTTLSKGSNWLHIRVALTNDDGSFVQLSDITSLALGSSGSFQASDFVITDTLWCSGPDEKGFLDLWIPFTSTVDYSNFNLRIGTQATPANMTIEYGIEFWHDVPLSELPDGSQPGGGTDPEPTPPGFEDEDGWLGSLINSILGGINELIEGISAIAGDIANLPGNIANSLSSFFAQVVSAVTSIGDQITNALTTLGEFLINGLKSLFIPSDGYFSSLFDRLNTFFSDTFGLLWFPLEHLLSLFDRVLNIQDSAPVIAIPELAFEGEVFIPAQTYTFDFLQDEPWATIHSYYLLAIDVALIGVCMKLIYDVGVEVLRK